jgi:hypothetical protein
MQFHLKVGVGSEQLQSWIGFVRHLYCLEFNVILLTVLDEVDKEGLQATSLVTTWRQPGCLYDLHAPQTIQSLSEVHCDLHDVC